MTGGVGPGRPPAATRFHKGQSGNPKGRPRSGPRAVPSAFDVVIDRTLTVRQSGEPREVTVEEALQHKTYADALAGSRAAQRHVLKWIEKRERWLAAKAPQRVQFKIVSEGPDPHNANAALLLLGIAERDARFPGAEPVRLRLQPWAVQAALSRRRGPLSDREVTTIEACTRDAGTLRWSAGARGERDE